MPSPGFSLQNPGGLPSKLSAEDATHFNGTTSRQQTTMFIRLRCDVMHSLSQTRH